VKIVFDCRYIRLDGRHDGISRYSAELVTALSRLTPVTMLISDERQLAMLPDLPWEKVTPVADVREPWVARQVNLLKPDVVYTPMQTMGSFGRKYPFVLTVHDLIYYSHPTPPKEFAPWVRALWRIYHLVWWPQRMLLNKSDAVATVSTTTRDLISRKHLTKRPVRVIRNSATMPETSGQPLAVPHKSLVYMGSFIAYKNVEALVATMELLPDYELHLMSRITSKEKKALIKAVKDARLVFHNGATDEEYEAELLRCTAFVSASLDEGFGIPVVEAMTLGVPVAISDIPIFHEVGGEAAVFFDQNNPESIAAAIRTLEDPAVRAAHSEASRAQAATFSWDTSAQQLLDLLTEVAAQKK
jgi:glycosyltransferase involved in cell wall biosynthesis